MPGRHVGLAADRRRLALLAANASLRVILTNDLIADRVDFAALLAAALPGLAEAGDPTGFIPILRRGELVVEFARGTLAVGEGAGSPILAFRTVQQHAELSSLFQFREHPLQRHL